MNLFKLTLALGLIAQLGCIPPVALFLPTEPKPFQGMPDNDPAAINQLAKESTRVLPSQILEPFQKIVDALLKMGYTISVSDSSAKIISFERSQKEPLKTHAGYGYDSAITSGTIRLSQENQDIRCVLVLTGKINWCTRERSTRVEVIPRLSPDEHKHFLDELFSKL